MKPNVLIDALSISPEKAYRWVSHLTLAMERYAIDSRKRRAAFLTFAWHESEGLTQTQVVLSSIPARRIQARWPDVFPTVDDARGFTGTGQALTNKVFAHFNGNGDYESGDGNRYRPRGLIPLCGRWTYELVSFALEFDFVKHPDVLAEDHWAALSAGWYWHEEGFNEMADHGDIKQIAGILAKRHLVEPELSRVLIAYRETLQVIN